MYWALSWNISGRRVWKLHIINPNFDFFLRKSPVSQIVDNVHSVSFWGLKILRVKEQKSKTACSIAIILHLPFYRFMHNLFSKYLSSTSQLAFSSRKTVSKLSVKSQIVIFFFFSVGHMVCIAIAWLYFCGAKAATDNTYMKGPSWF